MMMWRMMMLKRREIMMLRRRTDPRTLDHTLCEPAQSKCTSTCHKSHFIPKFTGKMPRPRMSPERRHTLCVSLRSRNACQDFTRGTLYGNLQEKCWGPPSSSTGLYTYRKNPSVRTHCLGNLLSRTQNITFAGLMLEPWTISTWTFRSTII